MKVKGKIEPLRLPSTEKFKSQETEDGFYIEGFASTNDIDRDFEMIPSSAVNLESFKKNPIILYQHNRDNPVGVCKEIERRDNGIWIKALISETAIDIKTMIKEGILSTFSCGFRIKDYDLKEDGLLIYTDIEFLETSIVSIPCNTEARFSMVKSYNAENLIKEDKIPETPTKKDDIKMDEKMLKEMQESVAKLKAEKEALEAEKAAKIAAEKEAKELAEKEAMKADIATMAETIKASGEVLEVLKAQIEEAKKELESKIEEVEKAAPRIASVEPINELKDFTEDFMDVAVEAMLFKKEWNETKKFDSLPERIKSVSLSSTFTTAVRDRMLQDIKEQAPISQLFVQLPSNVTTDTYPFSSDIPVNWGTSASDQTWAPSTVSIEYKSVFASTKYNYVTDEESIITWLPFLRGKLTEAVGEGIDTAIVARATVTNSFYPLPVWAFTYSDAVNTYALADEADLTVGDIDGMRAKMAKYGVNPKNLAIIVNSAKYLQLVDDDAVTPVDKFGAGATILGGQLASVRGIPVIVNDSAPGSSAVGVTNVGITMVNTQMWGFKIKSFMTEFEKAIATQMNTIVSSARVGFGALTPLTSSKITVPSVMCGYNPSS